MDSSTIRHRSGQDLIDPQGSQSDPQRSQGSQPDPTAKAVRAAARTTYPGPSCPARREGSAVLPDLVAIVKPTSKPRRKSNAVLDIDVIRYPLPAMFRRGAGPNGLLVWVLGPWALHNHASCPLYYVHDQRKDCRSQGVPGSPARTPLLHRQGRGYLIRPKGCRTLPRTIWTQTQGGPARHQEEARPHVLARTQRGCYRTPYGAGQEAPGLNVKPLRPTPYAAQFEQNSGTTCCTVASSIIIWWGCGVDNQGYPPHNQFGVAHCTIPLATSESSSPLCPTKLSHYSPARRLAGTFLPCPFALTIRPDLGPEQVTCGNGAPSLGHRAGCEAGRAGLKAPDSLDRSLSECGHSIALTYNTIKER